MCTILLGHIGLQGAVETKPVGEGILLACQYVILSPESQEMSTDC